MKRTRLKVRTRPNSFYQEKTSYINSLYREANWNSGDWTMKEREKGNNKDRVKKGMK